MPDTTSPDTAEPVEPAGRTGATQLLPVLAVTTGVIGPSMVVTVAVESADARTAIADAVRHDGRLLVVPRRADGGYSRVGTIAKVEQDGNLPNGERAVVLRGMQRAVLGAGVGDRGDGLWVEAEPVSTGDVSSPELDRLVAEYRTVVEAILDRRGARSLAESIAGLHDPNAVADLSLYSPDLDFDQKVQVLETVDVTERLRLVLGWARDTLAELTVRDELRRNLEDELSKEQRDAVLRRQLAAIQSELNDGGGDDATAAYRARLADLEAAGVPAAVTDAISAELDKLARTPAQNPEHGWIVGWLDTVFALPWAVRADQPIDLEAARAILDGDHAGLDKVKGRLVEYLAVRKLRQERAVGAEDSGAAGRARSAASGSILLLVGPPGVGKTSLGESVARALGRPFARVSLGGVRDEAEIRGHRRTYVGARAGRFVRALTEAGAMNPVLLLDEIDKVGNDWRGDPSAALLEVLDPAQNHTFRDHYLELDLDLSDVVFIATANQLDTIPGPLADRLEIIQLEGYVDEEKVAIARHHLLGRLAASLGLRDGEVVITDDALRRIIAEHTREAGVRELERQLAAVLRKLVTRLGEAPIVVGPDEVRTLLGRPRFHDEVAERTSVAGVATGLAVTGVGGGILFIEAAVMDSPTGEPGLTLTGQLGDVMRESAEIARSYVRSHRGELGLDGRIDTARLHLHVPAGATPKDGPSAGVTMTTALVSLLSGRAVRADVAMTGEVTLTGKVLPIGGVRQKLLAAQRAGITTVIIPKGNEADLDDVPAATREALGIHLASDVADVLAVALEPIGEPARGS
ncbi:MAG: endopeptidase La [Acidimicrobiales bacterium]|nr:endopeptidase La [Acidimicrobiales bacterium]